jgi:MbtH protein
VPLDASRTPIVAPVSSQDELVTGHWRFLVEPALVIFTRGSELIRVFEISVVDGRQLKLSANSRKLQVAAKRNSPSWKDGRVFTLNGAKSLKSHKPLKCFLIFISRLQQAWITGWRLLNRRFVKRSELRWKKQKVYKVVVQHERKHSIWPVEKPNPLGWKDAGEEALKVDGLDGINNVWTDMRSLSLTKQNG